MNDTLDDIMNESGDEEEQDAIVTQVLDEIGIDINGKLAEAPSAHKGSLGAETISKKNKEADSEIEAMLAQLKAWTLWKEQLFKFINIDMLTVKEC